MLKLYYQLEKFNAKDKLIYKSRIRLSRSFVKGFLANLYVEMNNSSSFSCLDVNNASQTIWFHPTQFNVNAPAGGCRLWVHYQASGYYGNCVSSDYIGIQIGTGTNPVTPTDYAMQTRIAHGSGAGQMYQFGTNFTPVTTGAGIAQFDVERIFRNNSGGSITVNEIGMYALNGYNGFCIIRDKLASGITVNDTEYLKVKYTIKITC